MPTPRRAADDRPVWGRLHAAAAGGLAVALVGGSLGIVGLRTPATAGAPAAATFPVPPLTPSNPRNLLLGHSDADLRGTTAWRGDPRAVALRGVPQGAQRSLTVLTPLRTGVTEVQRGTGSSALRISGPGIYTGAFLERASTVTATVTATLSWYDVTGAEISVDTVKSAPVQDSIDKWTRYTVIGLTPANAVWVSLGATMDSTTTGTQHYISSSSLTRTVQGSQNLSGPLTTASNKILDSHGQVVVLRGLNRPGQWETSQPGGLTEHDIARMKAWGANVVRLTLGQQVWMPGCGSYDSNYPAMIDSVVQWINQRGMLAVLDLHYGAPTCAGAGTNPMPDQRSVTFWREVATRYKNAPLVAFDLYNEVYGVSDQVWRDGGPATSRTGVPYTAVGMQALLDTVRSVGAENLVLIGGTGTTTIFPTTAPLAGHNLVYAVHAYNCIEPWNCHSTDSSWLLSRFVVPGLTVPIMVSEFGHPASGTADSVAFNAGAIAYADRQGWSWAAWAWDVHGQCQAILYFTVIAEGTCDSTSGTYEPAPAGMPILAGLAKNR
ncbi:MAG: cellulose-binding family [Frankiales bacterium]|nr:cellulose-binding family [Frankiales bacterium]